MADKGNMNRTSSISFTLPISCQICLGKVKQPIVCPNQHVFCSTCIELWLQHNQQCPTCRIPITPENPCKQVLGGPNFSEESAESTHVSTPALRKTRFDLLYKEYEDEIERLNNEVDTLKTQNQNLQREVSEAQQAAPSTSSSSSLSPSCKGMKLKGKEVKNDADVMLVLTSKLKEATATYEKVKHDMDKMKEVNLRLRDENASLLRETGRLKQLVVTRSPRKYEKYAISAQATKIDQCEKEVKQLKRALERSDIYVEELESKIAVYKANYGEIQIVEAGNSTSGTSNEEFSRSELENADLVGACGGSAVTSGPSSNNVIKHSKNIGKAVRVKQEVVDVFDETEGGESSFQLEQPSPITPASSLRRLTLESGTKTSAAQHNSSSTSTASSSASGSSLRSCTRQLDFNVQNQVSSTQQVAAFKSEQDSILEMPDFITNDIQTTPVNADTTLGNLDYSITPEFEACTKLLKAAEQRVHQRKQDSLQDNSHEALLEFQPGPSSTGQPTVKLVDYKSSYILPDCDPTFQFNPQLVSQTSTAASTSGLWFCTQGQRPPSAPATSTLTDTISEELFPQSAMPSHGSSQSTRPNSAPLVGTESASIQVQYQSQVHPTNPNTPGLPVRSNPLQVLNTSTSSAYLPPQSSSQSSLTVSTRRHSSALPLSSNMHTPFSMYSQSQPNQGIMTRGASKQQKTVYVLSGSRIAPLGERRKRSSSTERREQNNANNLCSPSKTQKF